MSELEEVKKNIRSLLVSTQAGLTTRHLLRDYEEIVYEELPYRRLGFSNPENFLSSIPDTVRKRLQNSGPVWVPVVDNSTAHISQLVSNQRPKMKGRRRLPPTRSSQSSGTLYRQPQRSRYPAPAHSVDVPRFQRMLAHHTPMLRRKPISSEVLRKIEGLLNMYTYGLKLSDLHSEYQRIYREILNPETFGYGSMHELVCTVPETIRMKNTGNAIMLFSKKSDNSKDVCWEKKEDSGKNEQAWKSNDSANNKVSPDGWTLVLPKRTEAITMNWRRESEDWKRNTEDSTRGTWQKWTTKNESHSGEGIENSNEQVQQSRESVFNSSGDYESAHRNVQTPSYSDSYKEVEVQSQSKVERPNSEVIYKSSLLGPSSGKCKSNGQESEWDNGEISLSDLLATETKNEDSEEAEDVPAISRRLKREFEKLLDIYPEGIKSIYLPKLYEKEFGKVLDFEELGFVTLRELISKIPNVFYCHRESANADWLLLDARKCDASVIAKMKKCKVKRSIPEGVKKGIIKLLSTRPKGILLEKFEETFRVEYRRNVPFAEYNYDDVTDFLKSLENEILYIQHTKFGELVQLIPDINYKFAPALKGSQAISKVNFRPYDALPVGAEIPLQELPKDNDKDYFEVVLSEIITPGHFYFYLRGEKCSVALEELMNRLEDAYDKNDNTEYLVPSEELKTGLVCAVLYTDSNGKQDWHRAKILCVIDNDTIAVSYIDYGTEEKVSKDKVRLLKKDLSKLPAQALEGKLGNVRPFYPDWPKAAREFFYNLVVNKSLVAKVTGKRVKPLTNVTIYGLCLIDTDRPDKEQIDITKALVNSGFACYFDEYAEVDPSINAINQAISQMYLNPMAMNPWLSYSALQMAALQSANSNMQQMTESQIKTLSEMYGPMGMQNYLYNLNSSLNSSLYDTQQWTINQLSNMQVNQAVKENPVVKEKPKVQIVRESSTPKKERNAVLKEADNFKKMQDAQDNLRDLLEEMDKKHYVKRAKFTSQNTVHLIFYNRELYLCGKEISGLLWDRDLLRVKLRFDHVKVPCVIINDHDNPEIFSELMNYETSIVPTDGGPPYTLMIYPLKCVTKIVDAFNPDLVNLKRAIADELERFDPNDTYWGNSDDGISLGDASESIDEISLGVQVLKGRKAAIEKEMKQGSVKQTLIQELSYLNERISQLDECK